MKSLLVIEPPQEGIPYMSSNTKLFFMAVKLWKDNHPDIEPNLIFEDLYEMICMVRSIWWKQYSPSEQQVIAWEELEVIINSRPELKDFFSGKPYELNK